LNLKKRLNRENIYSRKMKGWILAIFILLILALVNNSLNKVEIINPKILFSNILKASLHLIGALLYLYRPNFTNNTNFKITLSPLFNFHQKNEINIDLFELNYFNNFLYLDKEISIKKISNLINCSPEELNEYIKNTYKLNFFEFTNKKRVEYLVEILQNEKYNNYTIDAIAKISGFGSRSSMNRAFKKFHVGNPSDYSINNIN